MTETSPLASVAWPKHAMRDWDPERLTARVRTQAGLPLPGITWHPRTRRVGAAVRRRHHGRPAASAAPGSPTATGRAPGREQFDADGWFRTGDVAVGSPDGYFVIADRSKDLIKSGGEWISSVDMEADIMAMPQVAEAAVVAVPDPTGRSARSPSSSPTAPAR